MANFGLLNSAAAEPITMAQQVNQVTPLKNMENAYTLAGEQVGAQQKVQDFQQGQQGQQILQKGLQEKAFDLSTPEGWDKAVNYAQQNGAAPDYIAQLSDHATKVKTGYAQWQSELSAMEKNKLTAYDAGLGYSAQGIDALRQQYEKDKSEKGQEYANAQWQQNLPKLSEALKKTPYATPDVLKTLETLTYDQSSHLPAMFDYKKKLIEQRKAELSSTELETKAKLEAARAKSIAEGKALTYKDANGEIYLSSPGIGVEKWNGSSYELVDKVPPTATLISGGTGKTGLSQADMEKLTPETTQFLAAYTTRTGKPPPGIPAGSGAAATNARNHYLNEYARLATERGYSGDEAGELAIQRDASKAALIQLTKSDAVIATGEKDLVKNIKILKDEIKKVGGVDSPELRDIWNKASTQWAGSPDFIGINNAIVNLKDVAARVYSGQTGAGGTPVSYLDLMNKSIPDNPNLEQVDKLDVIMSSLFKSREESTKEEKQILLKSGEMVPKEGDTTTPAKAVEANTGIPATMPGNSMDAREELKRARQAAAAETDPEKKKLAVAAALALEKQIAGGSTPAPASAPASAPVKKSYSILWAPNAQANHGD